MTDEDVMIAALTALLRARAEQLALDPASICSPAPHSITARTYGGSLLRVDLSLYSRAELTP
jgi:hypothetical protein